MNGCFQIQAYKADMLFIISAMKRPRELVEVHELESLQFSVCKGDVQ